MINFIKKERVYMLLLLGAIFISACTSKNKKDKAIDFNTLSNASDYDENQKNSPEVKEINWYDSLTVYNKQLIDSLKSSHLQIELNDTTLFPDRFGALETQKINLITQDNFISLYTWDFVDSLKTKSAFYNWLDCFGTACKSIQINEEAKLNKLHTSIFVYPNKIVYIESQKALPLEKLLILPEYKKAKNKILKPLHIVFQAKGKKAKWMMLDDEGEVVEVKSPQK